MDNNSKFVCNCKAITRNEIINAIRKKGAESFLDIQNLTKASTGCGRCKIQVLSIIEIELRKQIGLGKQLRLDF
jgi:nitrite reductase (NADH) large subunit